MPINQNKTDLLRLLGTAKFLGKFVSNMSKITFPYEEKYWKH